MTNETPKPHTYDELHALLMQHPFLLNVLANEVEGMRDIVAPEDYQLTPETPVTLPILGSILAEPRMITRSVAECIEIILPLIPTAAVPRGENLLDVNFGTVEIIANRLVAIGAIVYYPEEHEFGPKKRTNRSLSDESNPIE